MHRLEVLFFTNIPSPYRIDFFNKLGEYCNLTVLFERKDARDRNSVWISFDDKSLNFQPVFLNGMKIGNDTAFCPQVCKYWSNLQYDIRIVGDYATPTGILSILYMRSRKIKYSIECDGGFAKDQESKIKYNLKRFLICKSEYIYSPGEITDKYLMRYGVSPDRILRYHFSSLSETDLDLAIKTRQNREQYRKKINICNQRVILFVGQIIQRKGIDILIQVASKLSEKYVFIVVGGEPTEEYISRIQSKHLRNIFFVGFKQKSDLKELYSAADLFFLPTREDIWGLVITEAMSYGLPVVTTDKCVAGVELLSSQNYAIAQVDDVEKMIENIQKIFEHYAICYGEQNIRKVKEYTIEQMVRDHVESFERNAGYEDKTDK